MEEEDEQGAHMPFGDTFGTRANYSRGMMYAGRRRFMDDESDNVLRPPKLFMTRPQSLRNAILQSTDKLSSLQNMAYFREEQNANANVLASKRKQQLLKKKVVEKRITVEMYSSTDPADWEEEFIAGCRMWTNHSSGEVSVVCPWAALGGEGAAEERQDAGAEGTGTGAPVYDSAELQDLLAELDGFRSPAKEQREEGAGAAAAAL